MTAVYLILLVGAAVCFGLEAAGVTTRRLFLLALGLLLWVLVPLLQTAQRL